MVLQTIVDRLGHYQSHKLVSWNVHKGANSQHIGTVTTLVYHVRYSNYDATEELTFFGSSPLQLVGHYIQSDALL